MKKQKAWTKFSIVLCCLTTAISTLCGAGERSCIKVHYPALVSQADLVYLSPVEKSSDGQPIGNGKMGTTVWTTPNSVNFQINHVDVFAVNKNHKGKRGGPTDYCGGCAKITIDVGGKPFEGGEKFQQRLSLYNAEEVITGDAVTARCFVSSVSDVMVVEVDDQRVQPQPVRLTVSMWRAPVVKTGEHIARYKFAETDGNVSVVQEFKDGDYYCTSAVAAVIAGGDTRIEASGDRTRTIVAPAKQGKTMLLISSAASFSSTDDIGATAVGLVKTASAKSYRALRTEHKKWWKEFWSRTFVYLESDDTVATFMQRIRTLHLYYMASTSRGVLPTKWNGSLFLTKGDSRGWGAQYWVWTTEVSHFPLYASDASELADPWFDMYVNQLPDARKAATQRWGVKNGAFFLEAGPFDGPVVLPPDIAGEYQDVYLGRKTVKDFSPAARELGLYECGLTQFADGSPSRGEAGRYSHVSHICSSGSEVATQAWWRYRYTGDTAWLASHAYPLLRDTLEFYRHLAYVGADSKYHFRGLNQHEPYWGVNDGITDLAAIRGTAPLAIRSAEILGVDPNLRTVWQDFLDNLTPYVMGDDPNLVPGGSVAPDVWAIGRQGPSNHNQSNPAEALMWPIWPFEDWTLETNEPATDYIVKKIAELNFYRVNLMNGNGYSGASSRTPILSSRVGRGYELPGSMASYYDAFDPLPNSFSLFEGANTQAIEALGCLTTAMQEGLLQSVSPRPGEDEIISVFPAWPKKWDASFSLLARGGFMVTSAIKNGQVEFIEVESRFGEPCRLRNPWSKTCVVSEAGGSSQQLYGDILRFNTKQGKHYRVLAKGAPKPAVLHIAPSAATEPVSYSMKLSNGKVVQGTLGRP